MGSRLDITCNILVVGLRRSWKCVLTDTISVSTATFNSPWPLADSTCNIKQELSLKKNYHWRRTITEEELSLKKNYHWRRTITEEELPLKKNYHWRRTITEEELSLKKMKFLYLLTAWTQDMNTCVNGFYYCVQHFWKETTTTWLSLFCMSLNQIHHSLNAELCTPTSTCIQWN